MDNKHLSQWQLKYKRDHNSHSNLSNNLSGRTIDVEEDSHNIDEWIANTTEAASLSLQLNLNDHIDSDVAEVIQQMKSVLSNGAQTQTPMTTETNCEDILFKEKKMLSDVNIGFDLDGQLRGASHFHNHGKNSFSTNQIAALFCKGRDESIARKCLRCLAKHGKREKKRLARSASIVYKRQHGKLIGKTFLLWKNYCRQMKVKEAVLVLKFGRVVSKNFRKAFASWKLITSAQNELEQGATERHQQRMLNHALKGWMHLTSKSKEHENVSVVLLEWNYLMLPTHY